MENRFKSWLSHPPASAPLGTWLMSAAPSTAEALGYCGFDFLVLDMEHVPLAIPDAIAILRAVSATPAEPVLRLAWNDPILIKQAMDAGATSLMVPFVQNADEAGKAVSFTRYPPEGIRGVAAMHRASRYGQAPDYLKGANSRAAVIVQLETPAAIARLPEIAAQPGVDALFLGPGDLSASMGHLGDVAHADVERVIADTAKAAKATGKPIGIVGGNPDIIRRYLNYGYSFAAISSDMAMMTSRARDFLSAVRGGTTPLSASAPY